MAMASELRPVPPENDLLIKVARNDGQRVLIFSGRNNIEVPKPVSIILSPSALNALADWQSKRSERLSSFHTAVVELASSQESVRWRKIDLAVKDMRRSGNSFLADFVHPQKLQELQTLLWKALPLSRQGRENPGRITLTVALEEDLDLIGLPLEVWPLLPRPTARPNTISNLMELEQSLLEFPGFAAVIAHRLLQDFNPQLVIERHGPSRLPPAKIISYKDFYRLDPALSEISDAVWLAKAVGQSEEAIWPDDDIEAEDATKHLAQCLSDPRRRSNPAEGLGTYADQIQHFSCHFTRQDRTGEWGLTLRDGRFSDETKRPMSPLRISLDRIKSDLVDYRPTPDEMRSVPGPLLFMNACASGAVDSAGTSLLETLLKWTPARAILVTETQVRYPLAADFACRVYKHLFAGKPLGLAVHAARWDLIIEEQNPFGFLYTLYGNPDIFIEQLMAERIAA